MQELPLRPLSVLLSIGMIMYGGVGARGADAPRPAPGEEYISAVMGGPVHPPQPAPSRKPGEGVGPFKRMVIRGATMIDGTGSPAIGPVDIVIENDRIARIVSVGYPKVPIKESKRPPKGDYEIDASSMYVLPGFINAHAHTATPGHGAVGEVPPAEYVYKLWMGHGITTVREAGSFNGMRNTLGNPSVIECRGPSRLDFFEGTAQFFLFEHLSLL